MLLIGCIRFCRGLYDEIELEIEGLNLGVVSLSGNNEYRFIVLFKGEVDFLMKLISNCGIDCCGV